MTIFSYCFIPTFGKIRVQRVYRILHKLKRKGDVIVENNIHIDFDTIDQMGAVTRPDKIKNRMEATKLLDKLVENFGGLDRVPEDNPLLHRVRIYLGAYEDAFTECNVVDLRERIVRLARTADQSQYEILELLSYEVDITARTIKAKIYKNRFTVSEKRAISNELTRLETIWGLAPLETKIID